MERNSRSRRVAGIVIGYYPDLGFGYLTAASVRVGFKRTALRGFKGDPHVGDAVRALIGDDGVAIAVTPLSEADVGTR